MPSHVFVQLGMSADSAASNEDAWAASEQWAVRRKLGPSERDYHTYSWLGASYLELGRLARARAVLDDIARRMKEEDGADIRFNYSALVRKYLVDTGRWSEARALFAVMEKPYLETGEQEGSLGCALHSPAGGGDQVRTPVGLFARSNMQAALADAAMRAGDEPAVKAQLEAMGQTLSAMEPWDKMLSPDRAERTRLQSVAYLAGARAFRERTAEAWSAAAEAMAKFADIAERRPPSGPAFEALPRLMVADFLLEANRPKDALAAYDATLLRSPNLSRALLGSARAAQRAGDAVTARDRYGALATQWKDTRIRAFRSWTRSAPGPRPSAPASASSYPTGASTTPFHGMRAFRKVRRGRQWPPVTGHRPPSVPASTFGAVIYDLDGLLIDSEPCWMQAEMEVLGALGVPLTREPNLTPGLSRTSSGVAPHRTVRLAFGSPPARVIARSRDSATTCRSGRFRPGREIDPFMTWASSPSVTVVRGTPGPYTSNAEFSLIAAVTAAISWSPPKSETRWACTRPRDAPSRSAIRRSIRTRTSITVSLAVL